jgi:hypothetical protein
MVIILMMANADHNMQNCIHNKQVMRSGVTTHLILNCYNQILIFWNY